MSPIPLDRKVCESTTFMTALTTKAKGDLLEDVITDICAGLAGSKVTRNARVDGRHSLTVRDVDVLIEGKLNAFDVRVAIEAKNYKDRVGVEKVEAFCTKLQDVGAALGVMVSSMGFTEPAKNAAAAKDVQLYEVYDQRLTNTALLLPVRLLLPEMATFAPRIQHRTMGPFSLPVDHLQWRIHVGEERLGVEELLGRAWHDGRIPSTPGSHVLDVGTVTIEDALSLGTLQYCELAFTVEVRERYYLKLFPASFIRSASDGREQHNLHLDMYSDPEKMVAHGWNEFDTLDEMEQAANIPNQPETIRGLLLRPRAPSP